MKRRYGSGGEEGLDEGSDDDDHAHDGPNSGEEEPEVASDGQQPFARPEGGEEDDHKYLEGLADDNDSQQPENRESIVINGKAYTLND